MSLQIAHIMRKLALIIAVHLLSSSISGAAERFFWPASLGERVQRHEQAHEMERDYAEVYRLYCVAALQNDAKASYKLGWMYFNGRGVRYDRALAMGWFKRAAELGDPFAENLLRRFPDVSAKKDRDCSLAAPGSNNRRRKIEAWVQVIAPQFEIDPNLVLAVINTESMFDQKARSPKDARGLMQLIPETATRFGVSDPWNPVENIVGGTAYLHWLTRHFAGDLKLVLAGYNAGEKAVEKYNGVPPFAETRQYVRKITREYRKTQHPVPVELRNLRSYAVSIMEKYSIHPLSKSPI
ncbi:MAG: lytic transglycosylase domain-containing protein [Gammaproteobacteria bacterium]